MRLLGEPGAVADPLALSVDHEAFAGHPMCTTLVPEILIPSYRLDGLPEAFAKCRVAQVRRGFRLARLQAATPVVASVPYRKAALYMRGRFQLVGERNGIIFKRDRAALGRRQ